MSIQDSPFIDLDKLIPFERLSMWCSESLAVSAILSNDKNWTPRKLGEKFGKLKCMSGPSRHQYDNTRAVEMATEVMDLCAKIRSGEVKP